MTEELINSTINHQQAQRILDHWHLGKIKELKFTNGYHKCYTSKGVFIIFEFKVDEIVGPDKKLRERKIHYIKQILQELEFSRQPTKRLLLKNIYGKLDPNSSLVHQHGHYYAVYQLIIKNRSQLVQPEIKGHNKTTKPVNLRNDTWNLIRQSWRKLDKKALKQLLLSTGYSNKLNINNREQKNYFNQVCDQPAVFLLEFGLLEKPGLLANTVIELPDEVEYLIDLKAAQDLATHQNEITLKTVYDSQTRKFSYFTVLNALMNGPLFDQLGTDKE